MAALANALRKCGHGADCMRALVQCLPGFGRIRVLIVASAAALLEGAQVRPHFWRVLAGAPGRGALRLPVYHVGFSLGTAGSIWLRRTTRACRASGLLSVFRTLRSNAGPSVHARE